MPLEDKLLEELMKGLSPSDDDAIWKPLDGAQHDAFYSPARELFYGGSAGGGKSDLLLGLILSKLSPHKRAIIFRRSYPESKGLIDRAQQILSGTGAVFKGGSEMRFVNIPGDKILEVGSIANMQMAMRYAGRAHDLKLFDEIADISGEVYRFLIAWARTSDPSVPVRIVGAGNPPRTAQGFWVVKHWAAWLDEKHPNKAQPAELRWFATLDGVDTEITPDMSEDGAIGKPFEYENVRGEIEIVHPTSRTFIPARVTDNPYLMETGYLSTLQSLPEPYRSQLLYGEFNFSPEFDASSVVPYDWISNSIDRWKAFVAKNDYTPLATNLTAFGVDVAEAGADKTTLAKIIDNFVEYVVVIESGDDLNRQVAEIERYMVSAKRAPIGVDAIGIGAGVANILKSKGYKVYPVKASKGTKRHDRHKLYGFFNVRSEMWWRLREALDPNQEKPLMLPDDPALIEEISSATFDIVAGEKIQVCSTDEIRGRIGRSPDKVMALLLALFCSRRAAIPLRIV